MEFKVGDRIVYEGNTFLTDVGRVQYILSIEDDHILYGAIIKTKFLDTGEYNHFGDDSDYCVDCIEVNSTNNIKEIVFENGIPLIWEDLV